VRVVERVDGCCGELVLRADGEHFEVIANGTFLMDTRNGESERLLVTAAADRMPAAGRVLVGGLGVGYSLRAALDHPRVRAVTVVEREAAVIGWAGHELAHLNGDPLADPRVECVEADLVEFLTTGEKYDALCLDIDNGPHWTVTEGNERLYDAAGLDLLRQRLTDQGVLAVWSAAAAPEFADLLATRFDEVQVLTVEVRRGEPDTVYVAR
jgi:spermidine synthase